MTELSGLPYAEMIARMRTAEVKQKILDEDSFFDDKPFVRHFRHDFGPFYFPRRFPALYYPDAQCVLLSDHAGRCTIGR